MGSDRQRAKLQLGKRAPWPDPVAGPWNVRLRWELIESRLECVGISIEPVSREAAAPLLSTRLRKLPLRRMVDEERRRYLEALRATADDGDTGQLGGRGEPGELLESARLLLEGEIARGGLAEMTDGRSSRRGGRPTLDDDAHYRKVAEVYNKAFSAGDFPRVAVAEHWMTARTTASHWIGEARDRDLIPKTKRGFARGGTPTQEDEG